MAGVSVAAALPRSLSRRRRTQRYNSCLCSDPNIIPQNGRHNAMNDRDVRISEALDHLDQANTIYNFVFFTLSGFHGTGDPTWDHRLAASVNVSDLLGATPELDSDTIANASEAIIMNRLPRLLCVSLVSAIETCLQDITEIHVRQTNPNDTERDITRAVRRLNAGGPRQYLPKLAAKLDIPLLGTPDWDWFTELVATRNILVHAANPIADHRYVANAGPAARAAIGDSVDVDNSYLVERYSLAKVALLNILKPI